MPEFGGAAEEVQGGAENEEQERQEEQPRQGEQSDAAGEGNEGARDEDTDGQEEALAAKPLRDPSVPTAAERAAHEATHAIPLMVRRVRCRPP